MTAKVLLLNPPSRRPLARDYFLGAEVEPDFVVPPVDLACLSASLQAFDLSVCDAVAEKLSGSAALTRCAADHPDFVVFLSSGASFMEDGEFLSALKARLPSARFVGLGDVYRDVKEPVFSLHGFLDAVALDFSTDDLARWLSGTPAPVPNIIARAGEGFSRGPERHDRGMWRAEAPRWDLFPLERYRWPFAASKKRASVLTEFGCPYLCGYCPASSLGHKRRSVESVLSEWRGLADLGVGDVLVRDQSFGSDRSRAFELLSELAKLKAPIDWTATMRVDAADPELLAAMRRAGCVGVGFGIDSGDDEILRAYKKTTSRIQARAAVDSAREAGLKTWGQFVVGFAMDTRESVEATLEFAHSLPLDWRTTRAESQRYAADYRREMLVRGLVPPEAMPPDTPTTISVWQGRLGLSNQDAFSYVERAGRAAAGHGRD